ncbi:RagB/SusD family nutrient uptake outer membrane protein [Paraflavisolibacter sp. H34]|uniref:RagB/SusD family nutrient uptake outer membrane protein n=1 Tax=Huijunlia imazamoxiresistens TaxID=3127457 RepID=UPI003016CB35
MTPAYKTLNLLLALLLALSSCTKKLNEEYFGVLVPEHYYRTEEEALSSVAGVYQRMAAVVNYEAAWRASELGTDEYIIAARTNGGWYDGGIYLEYLRHQVSSDNSMNNDAWNTVFGVIGAANAVLHHLEASPRRDAFTPFFAELKALRAWAYFYALDYWGNVPLVTAARVNAAQPPKNATRAEVFRFVETEMLAAAAALPSVTTVNRTAYYPRLTREALYTALATLYLNGQVYTGTAYWTNALEMANKVIDSKAYILEPNFSASFTGDNHLSKELIASFSIDPAQNAGANNYVRGALHPLHVASFTPKLPFVPANGYNTYEEALARYESQDVRRQYIWWGPQYDAAGAPLRYANGQQLVLVPIKDPTKAEDNEGYRVVKYLPDGKWTGRDANNDIVLVRYADVLLVKAEALLRAGKPTEALAPLNEVRRRSNASALGALTLQTIEDERGRELLWEGHRRRDMIRFGDYFTGTWKFHTSPTPAFRGLYPIPSQQLIANRNLRQNEGY